MSFCAYCRAAIDEDELGWCYMIIENEDLLKAHDECLEINTDVSQYSPLFDSSAELP